MPYPHDQSPVAERLVARRCRECDTTFVGEQVDVMFASGGGRCRSDISDRRASCRLCRQTKRDQRKNRDPFLAKVRGVITRHAKTFIRRGFIQHRDELAEMGWSPERMASECRHAYSNGCGHCGEKYASMGKGLWDITLDVKDPDAPPFYGRNTQWICQTCNRKKGRIGTRAWAIEAECSRRWRKRRADMDAGHGYGPLFDRSAS